MLDFLVTHSHENTILGQARRIKLLNALWLVTFFAVTGLIGLVMLQIGPKPSQIAWIVFLCMLAGILLEPRYGVYFILFFALVGDNVLTPWYPFTKNISSAESIFYLSNSLIFSPLEICIVVTFLSWLIRGAVQRKLKIYTGPLFWPAVIFSVFLLSGLIYGLGKGGSLNIALWEVRPIFYLPALLVLTSNLIKTRQQLNILMWVIMVSLFIEGIIGSSYYFFTLRESLGSVEAITEHSAAVHMNTLFIFLIAAWLYKASPTKRFALLAMVPPVMLTYLATQRRAAFIGMFLALGLIAVILYFKNRRYFFLFVPPLAVIILLYVLAFWNSSSTLGLPAQAIKSIVSPNQASQKDLSSNLYRLIENINSSFTIHTYPLTGVGFGRPFLILVNMPDISTFEWWQYITHNSIIWMWMKTGIGGFFSMFFLIGFAVLFGGRMLRQKPGGDMHAILLTAVLYIVMHFVYAYVDMSWDIQSMVYVGAMMGVINAIKPIVAQAELIPGKRWPWQRNVTPYPAVKLT